ncbi:unnamed protein product [Urochloa decumbens]|uniref:Uncharacterized protein n=1 Tax=Urochloa decumbens TaxID=240449 RepID=A0ABC8Y8H6_9POAL
MAEHHQPGSSAASAVTGDGQAAAHEKLQRLEMLLIRINAAVEVSEKNAAVGNSHLVRRRDALKEAASEGDEVLAFFARRAVTRNSYAGLGDASSSAAAGSLLFTWSALSPAMAHGVLRNSSKNTLFSDDDKKRLDTAVEKLEQLSPDVGEFIRLLQIEILPKIKQTWPLTRKRAPPLYLLPPPNMEAGTTPRGHDRLSGFYVGRRQPWGLLGRIEEEIWDEISSETHGEAPRRPAGAPWIGGSPDHEDYMAWAALLWRLSALVVGGRIDWAVNMMWGKGMNMGEGGGSGALAQWAAVLTDADRRGCAVLLGANRCLTKCSCYEPPLRCGLGRARDQVHRLVRGLEILAGDVESFGGLAVMCPWDFSIR